MKSELDTLLYRALSQPAPAIGYFLSSSLSSLFPDDVVYEGAMPAFDVEAYAREGLCSLTQRPAPHPQRLNHWVGEGQEHVSRAHNTFFDARWEGNELSVVIAHWPDHTGIYHYFIIASRVATAERFHAAVCAWNTKPPDDYILVFDVNGWTQDEDLVAAITGATLDTLVLRGPLKEDRRGLQVVLRGTEDVRGVRRSLEAGDPVRGTAG